MIKVYEATDIGLVRSCNEDSLLSLPADTYMVADGMGGHAAGEVASHIFVETARKMLSVPDVCYSELLLKKIVLQANQDILQRVAEHPEYSGMGTTATVFHLEGSQGMWAHVGDSRLYLLRDGCLRQVTRDHSLVSDLVENGTITQEQAKNHPRKNVLMRAVGVEEELVVDTGSFAVQPGDKMLLCSDGLTNMVENDKIRQLLEAGTADPAAALAAAALEAGGLDNVTALVVEYNAD